MYFYHADAVGLAGSFTRPVRHVIESQASCSLSPLGGVGRARVENFNFQNIVSFDLAQSDVTGGRETKRGEGIYVTRVSIVIEGLNILNMLTADRIVGRLAAEQHPRDMEPSIVTTGSHFEGLRIAGHSIEVATGHDLFSEMPTYAHWRAAWKSKREARSKIIDSLMGSTLMAPNKSDPWHLRDVYNAWRRQQKSSELKPPLLCSFVKRVRGITGLEINNFGPIITIPQFGTIYLGEVIIAPGNRRLNMLRLQLGSPDGGSLAVGSTALSGDISIQAPQLPNDPDEPEEQ